MYIDELARALAREGVLVDVFTRRHSPDVPATVTVTEGFTLHHVEAGPPREISPERALRFLGVFTDAVLDELKYLNGIALLHSHYWLSGWAGLRLKASTGLPMVNSFHTLGRVSDLNRRGDAGRSTANRLATEHEVIEESDRIIVSTEKEKLDLVEHYSADPGDICVAAPGVNHDIFTPGVKSAARLRLGWPNVRTVLFVGRIQSLKGPDVVLDAFAAHAGDVSDSRLVLVGAPTGSEGADEYEKLKMRVKELDLGERVTFAEPVPHREMPDVYRASDVVMVPSRAESFGLVAAEAQACGVPVIAADIGGLSYVVPPGSGGILVEGWDSDTWADALNAVLSDEQLSDQLSRQGPITAEQFSWETAVERIVEIYRGVV